MESLGRSASLSAAGPDRPPAARKGVDPFTEDPGLCNIIEDLMQKWHVPGLAVAVVDGDRTWAKGFGYATVGSVPVTPSTLFYAGSTTKAWTSAAAAHLIDSRKFKTRTVPSKPIDWTTSISSVMPDDFVLMDDWATKHITIEDILCHRTGMPRHEMSWQYRLDKDNGGRLATVRDVTRSLRHLPPNLEPRTRFQYCNLMYCVASDFVETLTGKWLGDVLREWMWKPLGMDRTYFSLEDAKRSPEHLANGYYWGPDDGVSSDNYKEVRHMPTESLSGAGAVISTVLDYAKWIRCLMDEAEPLSKATHDVIKAPRIFASSSCGNFDAPPAYALGWESITYKGHRVWAHDGATDSFGAEVIFIPDLKFGVVTFANTSITSNLVGEVISWRLIDDRLGLPQDQRADWEAKWKGLFGAITGGRKKALDDFYPNRPKPSLNMTLPVERYAGTYHHPGYLSMILEVAGSESTSKNPQVRLTAVRANATWPIECEFEHVSGEYWLMSYSLTSNPGATALKGFAPVEFRLGADGKVASMGIEWRAVLSNTVEGLVWFDRAK